MPASEGIRESAIRATIGFPEMNRTVTMTVKITQVWESEHFRSGCEPVWTGVLFNTEETLSGGPILPGLEIAVAELFR